MPEYQYKCESCRVVFTTLSRTEIPPCPVCGYKSQRDYSTFQARPSMPEHFNHAIGRPVTNMRDLRDALKRQSDEASERNGIEHNLEFMTRAEMADPSAHGVTGEGLESQQKAWRDMGQVSPNKLVIP
jgi:hypothetical protein